MSALARRLRVGASAPFAGAAAPTAPTPSAAPRAFALDEGVGLGRRAGDADVAAIEVTERLVHPRQPILLVGGDDERPDRPQRPRIQLRHPAYALRRHAVHRLDKGEVADLRPLWGE